jgi:putative transposase
VATDIQQCVRTFRMKVTAKGYAWLDAAATEVNQVWNYANATSYKAARPFAGTGKWLSAFDLNNLTAGATEYFDHIGSETIQRVNAEFATRRKQFKKVKLCWQVSRGSKRSLGWIPFKAAQLKRKGKSLRFSGKTLRVFERELLEGTKWKSGCFAQVAVGDWWLCLPVAREVCQTVAPKEAVGIDCKAARCKDLGVQCVWSHARSGRQFGPKSPVRGEFALVRRRERVVACSR